MFNGRTSAFQADDASSILATRSIAKEKYLHAHIAQSVEHFLGKEEVTGSNPVMSSTNNRRILGFHINLGVIVRRGLECPKKNLSGQSRT